MPPSDHDRAVPPALEFPGDERLLDALGSEALIIQNKRSALTNEATNRSSLFVAIVSGALVAAGFVARTAYALSFLAIVLPIVLVLGTVTLVRLAAIARDDRRLDEQLEWLRVGFRGLSPRGTAYLLEPAEPRRPSRRIAVVLTSAAGFIGLLDAALLGLGVALLVGLATGRPASPASSLTGVAASLAGAAAMVAWLLASTSERRTGPDGTPAAAPGETG